MSPAEMRTERYRRNPLGRRAIAAVCDHNGQQSGRRGISAVGSMSVNPASPIAHLREPDPLRPSDGPERRQICLWCSGVFRIRRGGSPQVFC